MGEETEVSTHARDFEQLYDATAHLGDVLSYVEKRQRK